KRRAADPAAENVEQGFAQARRGGTQAVDPGRSQPATPRPATAQLHAPLPARPQARVGCRGARTGDEGTGLYTAVRAHRFLTSPRVAGTISRPRRDPACHPISTTWATSGDRCTHPR